MSSTGSASAAGSGPARVLWAANVRNHGLLERADAAAAAGYASMSVFTTDALGWEAEGGSLAQLRTECEQRGGPISAVDPYLGWYPGYDASSFEGEAAAFLQASEDDVLRYTSELGATYLTLVGPFWGPDAPLEEVAESLGRFVDRAAPLGIRCHLETVPSSKVHDIQAAIALVDAVGRNGLGILIDTFNLSRAGNVPADLDAVRHDRIFQIQLADASREPRGADYFEEALHWRELPGAGELLVTEMLAHVSALGPLAPTGPEVFSDALDELTAVEAARAAATASDAVVASAVAGRV